jgi:hypothetical protein
MQDLPMQVTLTTTHYAYHEHRLHQNSECQEVPFYGTDASFYLWTTQIFGFAETYNCAQALLSTITVTPASAVLIDADPDEHKLLQGRRANSTAMVLLRISLTDDISVDQI